MLVTFRKPEIKVTVETENCVTPFFDETKSRYNSFKYLISVYKNRFFNHSKNNMPCTGVKVVTVRFGKSFLSQFFYYVLKRIFFWSYTTPRTRC